MFMEDQEAKDLVNKIFSFICQARSIGDLEKIENCDEAIYKNRMDINSYPKIDFDITPKEIKELNEKEILINNSISEMSICNLDPLTKLLYSLAWKNGDLKKVRHIDEGILDDENKSDEKEDGLVFYQFGKYLTKEKGQPIIDQHVLRAFAVYSKNDLTKVKALRAQSTINKKHKELIEKYKAWLISDKLNEELKQKEEYSYFIDKVLFALGKAIKIGKKRSARD